MLVLVRDISRTNSYNDDWRDAIAEHPGFDVDIEDIEIADNHAGLRKKIERCPFIVALHATNANGTQALEALSRAFEYRQGKLAVFVGNEVNLPFPTMRSKLDFLKAVQPDLIATQLIESTGRWFYEEVEGAVVRNITHAMNPTAFRPGPPLAGRPIDVGSRSERYNVYVGDTERVELFDKVRQRAQERNFQADIVLGGERFDRAGWAAFLAACKATIGTEAGSHFLDRDDRLSAEVDALLRVRSGGKVVIRHQSPVRSLTRLLLPRPARHQIARWLRPMMVEDVHLHQSIDETTLAEIRSSVFRPGRRAAQYTKCVSSRHFDAAACKTLQILTPGRYNDMLQPGRHFLQLNSDFGNLDAVLEQCRDLDHCQRLVDEAYEDLLSRHSYRHRMSELEQALRSL